MAKKPKTSELSAEASASRNGDGLEYVTIRLPLGPREPVGYQPHKVETRLELTSAQPLALRRLRDGFSVSHAQLTSGKHIDSYAETVRKVLELVAEASEKS